MERYSIGLDLGTSSVKGVLFSDAGHIVKKSCASFEYKKSYLPNGAEYLGIDPDKFYERIAFCLRELSENIPTGVDFCGISIASASGNAIICDERGEALIDGYSWLNKPFSKEIEALFGESLAKELPEIAGWGLAPSFPLGQLAHLKLHAPALLEKAATVCMMTEYVLHKLTSRWGIDVSTATPSYLFDQRQRSWNKELLAKLGISAEKLPPIFESGTLLGKLNERAAELTGLPKGCSVYLGSFDHPSAARGTGTLVEGDLLISCGTSWVCFLPFNERDKIIKNSFLCDPFLSPEGPWGAMFSLERASEKISALVEKYIATGEEKFKLLDKFADGSPLGANGLSFDPLGEVPNLSEYKKEDVARALMEGIARALKERVFAVAEIKSISMCGGPSESATWRRIISEIFEAPVRFSFGAYSGAVGAAKNAFK